MRAFNDPRNVNHDLVISNPNIKRVRQSDVEVAFGDYLWKRYMVGISEAFLPVHEALTKTMRRKVSTWSDNHAFKRAFDAFLVPFQAAVKANNRPVKLKKGSMWPRDLTFADLSLCLEKVRINFAGVARLERSLCTLEKFFEQIVVEALVGMWSRFEESHVPLNDTEKALYESLKNDPLSLISQWVSITNVNQHRNVISHLFTVGKDFDLVDAKLELQLVEGVCEKEIAKDFKDILKFCVTYCKYSLHKAEVAAEEKSNNLDAMFHNA